MAKTPQSEPPANECRVSVQAVCRGGQGYKVLAVAGTASDNGQPHIAVRVGRILIYVADHEALGCFVDAWRKAEDLGQRVFPEVRDVIWQAKQADRQHFERTGLLATRNDRRRQGGKTTGR